MADQAVYSEENWGYVLLSWKPSTFGISGFDLVRQALEKRVSHTPLLYLQGRQSFLKTAKTSIEFFHTYLYMYVK